MEPYFADQCRTLTEKIRALREPDDLCFALLAGTAVSDFADHTDENIRAVDAQTHFDGVIHLDDILNGSIPENASRFVLSQELARFQNATASGKLYIACGYTDLRRGIMVSSASSSRSLDCWHHSNRIRTVWDIPIHCVSVR